MKTILFRPRRDKRTLAASTVAIAAVALAVTAATNPFAVHTGLGTVADATTAGTTAGENGGCQTYDVSGAAGWNIGVCISGTGYIASPDIYVNSMGSAGGSCKIDIETWGTDNNKVGDTQVDCPTSVPAHIPADNVTVNSAMAVHAFARLRLDGVPHGSGDSKPVALKYDAARAAAWATANISGAYFSSGDWYIDDCADFVSTAMSVGGTLPMTSYDTDHRDDHNWWMVTDGSVRTATYSWTSAAHLEHYLTTSGRGTPVSLQAAKPGDVIFVNWGSGGRDTPDNNASGLAGIDHVGMVVGNPGASGGYNVKIAQHTRDTIETLADWRAANPNLQVWVYSIS